MPARAIILRQMLLVQRLQRGPGQRVPFAELRRHLLAHGSLADLQPDYTQRTFDRDRREIEEQFGITIKCQRGRGYYIAETEPLPPNHAALLAALELQEFLRLPAALVPFVQAEVRRPLGLEYLRPLLRAAQAGHIVELQYQKHWEPAAAPRSLGPLLLRESRGRWYVLGLMEGSGRLACFALDRIRQLTPTSRPFQPPADFDAASYFAHCFGITRPTDGQEPELVRLRFAPVQGRYALSFPLHASQQFESETDDAICLCLRVYDTHELRMELLSYGAEVEVLAPTELRQWMQQAHTAAAAS